MAKTQTRPFDVADHLDSPETIAAYLNEAFETGDMAFMLAAVRDVARALQAKIQQMILDDALVDRDGAVPPGYEGKVADYFRVLSEDVR